MMSVGCTEQLYHPTKPPGDTCSDWVVSDYMQGSYHPLTALVRDMVKVFEGMGFEVALGPEIESEWYNMDALNIPKDHPARDMQDTFFIKGREGTLLRTHTSPVQIRTMERWVKEGRDFPIRIVCPGLVFRNEATDATHEAQFMQIEGLVVGEDVTMAHLKGTLKTFFSEYLGSSKIRFLPIYFPFVEPGVQVDIWRETPEGGAWLELMGAGMVHPKVLEAGGIDSTKYRGFAFGMGLDRLAMGRYGIPDVRMLYNADLRALKGLAT